MPMRPYSRRPVSLKTPTSRRKRGPGNPARRTPSSTTAQPETSRPSAPLRRRARQRPSRSRPRRSPPPGPGSGARRRRSRQHGRPPRRERPAARPASSAAPLSGYGSAQPPQSGAAQYGAAQPSAAQYGPAGYESAPPGSAQYGANLYGGPSYGGPSAQQPGGTAPYLDQSIQYPLGSGGGRAQRRVRPRWRLILIIVAVLVAVAIGAGAAIALGHNGPAATAGTHGGNAADATTPYKSVNALNHPSSAAPAGWVPEAVQPTAGQTNAGFTVSVPPGWTEQRKGLGTFFHGPADMLLEIDLTPHKHPNNMVLEADQRRARGENVGQVPAVSARCSWRKCRSGTPRARSGSSPGP